MKKLKSLNFFFLKLIQFELNLYKNYDSNELQHDGGGIQNDMKMALDCAHATVFFFLGYVRNNGGFFFSILNKPHHV